MVLCKGMGFFSLIWIFFTTMLAFLIALAILVGVFIGVCLIWDSLTS